MESFCLSVIKCCPSLHSLLEKYITVVLYVGVYGIGLGLYIGFLYLSVTDVLGLVCALSAHGWLFLFTAFTAAISCQTMDIAAQFTGYLSDRTQFPKSSSLQWIAGFVGAVLHTVESCLQKILRKSGLSRQVMPGTITSNYEMKIGG